MMRFGTGNNTAGQPFYASTSGAAARPGSRGTSPFRSNRKHTSSQVTYSNSA